MIPVWENFMIKYKVSKTCTCIYYCKNIEHYLTDRKPKEVVEGFSSSFKSINVGAPQCSELGCFFVFITYKWYI